VGFIGDNENFHMIIDVIDFLLGGIVEIEVVVA